MKGGEPHRLLLCALCLFLAGCGAVKVSPPFLGVALDGYPVTSQRVQSLHREFPVAPEIVLFYLQWPKAPQGDDFPNAALDAIWDAGAVPCLTWEPMYHEDGREHAIDHRLVLDGSYDRYIAAFAAGAKRWGKPFIIRFAHEMNLSRYHWGTSKERYGPDSPVIYRRMHRHVVDLFRREGAANVLWAFVPNAESVPAPDHDGSAGWNRIANYYPGSGYVDILGMDGYNWGTSKTMERDRWESRWLTFGELFSAPARQLRELSAQKPLMVFETASTAQGGDKERWFREAVATAEELGVSGVVWFQVQKEQEWRIDGGACPGMTLRRELGPQQWLRRLLESVR